MFYEPKKDNHGLAQNPFKSIVIPRPIGWISSVDAESVINLAPYSFFNAVSERPPIVMFASGSSRNRDRKKDTLRNIETTKEFVCNIATWALRDHMNESSAVFDPKIDELDIVGLKAIPSEVVSPPRVAETPIHLECKYIKRVDLPFVDDDEKTVVIFGEVVGIHIRDDLITGTGLVDVDRLDPIGRLGYADYVRINKSNMFPMTRPT